MQAARQTSNLSVIGHNSKMEFIKRIAYIQQNVKANKENKNQFGGYAYRNAGDIMHSLKPHLGDLAVFVSDEIVEMSGRVYVKATVTITDGENEHSVSAYAREAEQKKGMDPSQCTGASSSYACKYALEKMFLIDNNQDADSWDNRQNGNNNQRSQQNHQQQYAPKQNNWNNNQRSQQNHQQQYAPKQNNWNNNSRTNHHQQREEYNQQPQQEYSQGGGYDQNPGYQFQQPGQPEPDFNQRPAKQRGQRVEQSDNNHQPVPVYYPMNISR